MQTAVLSCARASKVLCLDRSTPFLGDMSQGFCHGNDCLFWNDMSVDVVVA